MAESEDPPLTPAGASGNPPSQFEGGPAERSPGESVALAPRRDHEELREALTQRAEAWASSRRLSASAGPEQLVFDYLDASALYFSRAEVDRELEVVEEEWRRSGLPKWYAQGLSSVGSATMAICGVFAGLYFKELSPALVAVAIVIALMGSAVALLSVFAIARATARADGWAAARLALNSRAEALQRGKK